MFSPFVAELWNQPVYAKLLDEVDPRTQADLFRQRNIAFSGNNNFWATPSPEPELPQSLLATLEQPLTANNPLGDAAKTLSARILARYQPENIVFVAILRAGVPVADWLTQLLPGSVAVATSLFVGLGIDSISLQSIQRDYRDRTIIFVDGWTGKGAVANELRKNNAGPLAVLCDPWQAAEYCGTTDDILSPSAFFTGPVTLGFSRTFTRQPAEPFAAYKFPKQLLVPKVIEAWQRNCPSEALRQESVSHAVTPFPANTVFHNTPLRLHSNEVCRALINSNPQEIMFADSRSEARERYDLLLEFADLQKLPTRFSVSAIKQLNARVACSLKVKS